MYTRGGREGKEQGGRAVEVRSVREKEKGRRRGSRGREHELIYFVACTSTTKLWSRV